MTAAPTGSVSRRGMVLSEQAVDAEFDVLPASSEQLATVAAPGLHAMSLLATPGSAPSTSKPARPVFWIGGVALVLFAFWAAGGHALMHGVGDLPFMSGPIVIASVETRIEASAGRDLLMIDGEALNQSPATQTLPSIGVEVSTPAGSVTRYTIGSAQKRLAAGETYLFSGRLRVPEEGVKSVSVTLNPLD